MANADKKNMQEELMKKIDDGVTAFLTSGKYQDMLKELSRFRSYSFNNRMLILTQNPEATLVNSMKRWNSLGRYVKKGEKALKVLAPNIKKRSTTIIHVDLNGDETEEIVEKAYCRGFSTVNVFDVSQTEGNELTVNKICEDLDGNVEGLEKYFDAAKEVVPVPIKIEKPKPGMTAKGYCNVEEIVIFENSGLQMFKTLVHEMAHVLLNHTSDKCDISRDEKECQAESVAYMVASTMGYDVSDYSFEYIGTWAHVDNGLEKVKKNLETIVKTAETILKGFDKVMAN